jgi:hypothetical protein
MEIKKSDINALANKLETFAKDLPEQEQNVLHWVLARAKSAHDSEVSDSDLDSASGGTERLADESISVGWSR